MELLSNLTWAWPSESDVAPVTLQSQTYSIRFGWWQVWRLNQALFYRNSKRCCCFYSVILNCLIDNFCSRCSLRLLVLHLKRYEYDNLTEEQAKKQDKVNIKRFIDLSKCQGWVLEVNHLLHICVQLNFDWGGGWGWGWGWGGRRNLCEPMGTYHLHGKTGNSGWKIKWFAPFCLGTFRKHGLWFEAMQFFYSVLSVQHIWNFVVDGFPTPSVLCLCRRFPSRWFV